MCSPALPASLACGVPASGTVKEGGHGAIPSLPSRKTLSGEASKSPVETYKHRCLEPAKPMEGDTQKPGTCPLKDSTGDLQEQVENPLTAFKLPSMKLRECFLLSLTNDIWGEKKKSHFWMKTDCVLGCCFFFFSVHFKLFLLFTKN